jgi:hypothetical protein
LILATVDVVCLKKALAKAAAMPKAIAPLTVSAMEAIALNFLSFRVN